MGARQVDQREEQGAAQAAASEAPSAPGKAPPNSAHPTALSSEQQREALLSMGLLAAGLIHEVKNSLTGVIGLLQLARRDEVNDSAGRADLPRVERELRDCVDRLNRFLSLRPDSAGGRGAWASAARKKRSMKRPAW